MLSLMFNIIFTALLLVAKLSLNATVLPLIKVQETFQKREFYILDTLILEDNSKWLLKQTFSFDAPNDALGAIFEYIVATIAESVAIPTQQVIIASPTSLFLKKRAKGWATLHSWINGISYQSKHPDSLQQKVRSSQTLFFKKKGPLPSHKKGLTRKSINAMACHPDAPALMALDTFLCHRDRTDENSLINSSDNHLYSIDGENLVPYPLAKYALRTIKKLIEAGVFLTSEEIVALKQYRTTLQKLISLWPLKKIKESITQALTTLNLLNKPYSKINDAALYQTLLLYKRTLSINRRLCKKLINYLDVYLESREDKAKELFSCL